MAAASLGAPVPEGTAANDVKGEEIEADVRNDRIPRGDLHRS
jgi:hypothetical protein